MLEDDEKHYVDSYTIKGNAKACLKNLSNQLKQQSNVELFKSDKNYFRFVYTSSLMRFKDDLEIYIDPKKMAFKLEVPQEQDIQT